MRRRHIPALTLSTALLLAVVAGAGAIGPGEAAPDWTLTDIRSGESVTLSNLQGKYVLLDFWATWCGPCRHAMEHELNPLWQMLGDRDDWTLISIGLGGNDTPEAQRQFADSNGYGWQFVHDPGAEVAEQYDVTGIPTLVMINPQGVIEALDHHGVGLTLAQTLDPSITALVPRRTDLAGSAQPLTVGQPVQGQVPQGGEVVYALTAPAAGQLVFETSGTMDTVLQIFGTDGNLIEENDDVSPGVYTSRIQLPVSQGQQLYVLVKGYSGSGGDFGLTVN